MQRGNRPTREKKIDRDREVRLKTRMSLIFAALVVILVSMIWVVRDRGNAGDVAQAPAMAPQPPIAVLVQSVPAPVAAEVTQTPPIPAAVVPPTKSGPLVHVATDGNVNYTARAGDTVSDLATALKGSDSKANRDAVIASNTSLQANPDHVLDGKTYTLQPTAPEAPDAPAAAATDAAAPATPDAAASAATNTNASNPDASKSDSQRNLKYTAQPGDNVAVLAASLLGGDTKTNRDAVISGNASLQRDPDHLVAGKTYNIPTTSGLSAAPGAPGLIPTTQPGADEAARLSVGRVLSYTAQTGDSVSKLAIVLLGSDTKANRDAIIANNHSLKEDPDHLVAGQTYWISAPTASTAVETGTP
jgi:hypothetical protein